MGNYVRDIVLIATDDEYIKAFNRGDEDPVYQTLVRIRTEHTVTEEQKHILEHLRLEGALWIVKQLLKQNAHDEAALLDAKKQIMERLAAQPKDHPTQLD